MHAHTKIFSGLICFAGVWVGLAAQTLPPPILPGAFELEVAVAEESWQSRHDYEANAFWPSFKGILYSKVEHGISSAEAAADEGRPTRAYVPLDATFEFTHADDVEFRATAPKRFFLKWSGGPELIDYDLYLESRGILKMDNVTLVHENGAREDLISYTMLDKPYTLKLAGQDVIGGDAFRVYKVAGVTKQFGPRREGDAGGDAAWGWWELWQSDGSGGYRPHLLAPSKFNVSRALGDAAYRYRWALAGQRWLLNQGAYGHITQTIKGGYYEEKLPPPLAPSVAINSLEAMNWNFPEGFPSDSAPTAHYAASADSASASKLRYKLSLEPGFARTITWAETFTPEGSSVPTNYLFRTERVSATATETSVYEIDPLARSSFGSGPGVYNVFLYEANLLSDANNDGLIVSPSNPLTPYILANADAPTSGAALAPNLDDTDADNVADATDDHVNGIDDLASFSPVFLDIWRLVSVLRADAGFSYKLKHADNAVNFVYTNLTAATAFNYRNAPDTGFGRDLDRPAASAPTLPVTAAGVDLFAGETGSAAFLNAILTRGGGVILVEATKPTDQPLVLEVTKGSQIVARIELPLSIYSLSLAVDANRDGTIKLPSEDNSDATTAEKPYRFWPNDDDDDGDDKRSSADDVPLSEGAADRDSANATVDGIRDLEDFFPVFLDLKQLLAVLPSGTDGNAYYLKQEDEAVGVVFTSYTRTQAFDYLRGAVASLDTGFGPALTQKAGEATVTKVTAAGVNITASATAFLNRIKDQDGGIILVEASKVTTKPLVLEVRKGTDVIATVKLELKIDPVETMIHFVNFRSFAHGTPVTSSKQGPGFGSTTPTPAPNDPFATVTNRKNLVFVHGYNVNGEAARGSAATVFKRFYWSGSKAKFYAVLWRGDDGQGAGIAPAGATPDYHRNVGHAWQQAPYLRDFLLGLQGDTAIMAHSLGNLVTQAALTYERDPANAASVRPASRPSVVKNYFAIDAALPLEATASDHITSSSKSEMRHPDWAEYSMQERLWPSHWHALFQGSGDSRAGLTWQNVFANLEVGTNFYSSGEEVLANPESDSDSIPAWQPLFGSGRRAWVCQEKLKGGAAQASNPAQLAAIQFFRSWTAGWVENKAWYVPIVPPPPFGSPQTRRRFASEAQDVAAPNGVPTSSLASEPFFQRFQASEDGVFYPGYQGSRLHAPIGDTNAADEACKLVTVAKCLAEAIPALSYPQGSNPATKFDRLSGNFDLNEPYDPNTGLGFKNGWPAARPNQNWLHSDCLDVAYIFHFKFYDRMKTNGELQ